jgi:hypothetical protein
MQCHCKLHELGPTLDQVLLTYPVCNFMKSTAPSPDPERTMFYMFPFQANLFFTFCLGWNIVLLNASLLSPLSLVLH